MVRDVNVTVFPSCEGLATADNAVTVPGPVGPVLAQLACAYLSPIYPYAFSPHSGQYS